jgi:hypothetical protein
MTPAEEQTFQAPIVSLPPAPAFTLFDSRAVAIATFFGTPVAGGSLMALNYRRLGQSGKAMMTMVIAIAVTGLAILIGWNIPQGVSSLIALALVIGMRSGAQSLQGTAIKDHIQRGGRLGSKWRAFWLGIGLLVTLFSAVFIIVLAKDHKTGVVFGSKDEVYYSGTATKEDAQLLGNTLKTSRYFSDKGADVLLAKGKDGTIVSFIVKEGVWNEPATVAWFEVIGQQIAPMIGGFPIQVRLLNKHYDVKTDSIVGQAVLGGKDHVYYFGSASAVEAQALGQALQSVGFFEGKGTDVFLSKHSNGTVLSFVVGDGVWDDAALVADFEKIGRQVASTVGGTPVRLRLVNTLLVTKKDEVLN